MGGDTTGRCRQGLVTSYPLSVIGCRLSVCDCVCVGAADYGAGSEVGAGDRDRGGLYEVAQRGADGRVGVGRTEDGTVAHYRGVAAVGGALV